MNCPHCGKKIPAKTTGHEAKYREDVRKAEAALAALERAITNPDDLRTPGYGIEPRIHFGFIDACASEILRLVDAIENPAKLYAIYRRGDRKTPVAYGMGTIEASSND